MEEVETKQPLTKLRLKLFEFDVPNYRIGALAGIHHSTLSLYVQGKADIKTEHLIALCEVLDCQPEDILGMADET